MKKNTPGPWRHYDDEVFQQINGKVSKQKICSLVSAGGDSFAEDEEELIANARLIAAAPDLLEQLKDTVGTIQTLLASSHLQQYKGLQTIGADIVRNAQETIAKATQP